MRGSPLRVAGYCQLAPSAEESLVASCRELIDVQYAAVIVRACRCPKLSLNARRGSDTGGGERLVLADDGRPFAPPEVRYPSEPVGQSASANDN